MIQITDPQIHAYAEEMTSPESKNIEKLVASSGKELEHIDMLSGKLVGELLKILIRISGAKRVLEIGTFTGYSALMMAEALPDDGELITMEFNSKFYELAEKHFKEFDTAHKIRLIQGDARELIDELEGEFDLVFLDADKISYPLYYENSLKKIKPGGMLVADNVLWGGTVLNHAEPKARALHIFNERVARDERVEQVLLPLRDGLTLLLKK